MKKKLIVLVLSSVLSHSIYAGGIPVFDGAGLAQALQTVVQLKQQIEEIKSMRAQFEGVRNMGALLNTPELKNYLPQDLKNVYDEVKNGSYKGLDGAFNGIEKLEAVTGTKAEVAAIKQRRWEKAISDKAMGEAAYDAAMQRLTNIESLGKKIDTTQDAKAAIDLQARISQEQALVQSEFSRMQLMSMLQQAEDRLVSQKEEKIQKAMWDINKPMPRY